MNAEETLAQGIDRLHDFAWHMFAIEGRPEEGEVAPHGYVNQYRSALAELVSDRDVYRAALETIASWDCLNPPDAKLCADHPWLKRLVDSALDRGAA